jgi:hypothetical protein
LKNSGEEEGRGESCVKAVSKGVGIEDIIERSESGLEKGQDVNGVKDERKMRCV